MFVAVDSLVTPPAGATLLLSIIVIVVIVIIIVVVVVVVVVAIINIIIIGINSIPFAVAASIAAPCLASDIPSCHCGSRYHSTVS